MDLDKLNVYPYSRFGIKCPTCKNNGDSRSKAGIFSDGAGKYYCGECEAEW